MTTRFRLVFVNLMLVASLTACGPAATVAPTLPQPTATPLPPTPTAIPPTPIPLTAVPTVTIVPSPSATPKVVPIEQIDNFLASLAKSKAFSGSVLLAKNGKILLSKGYGLADQAQKIPNTPQTRFRIYSITKQFTAMGVMILQNKGKLNVQNPICNFIKNCPEEWKPITIHQLLTHTSGIPDFFTFSDSAEKITTPMTPEQLVDWFKGKPLDFQPGEKFSYSNSGYDLLGYIIEKASGQPYGAFLKQFIFDPLSMANTGYDPTVKDIAVGYKDYSYAYIADKVDLSVVFAAGGLISTVEDLHNWDQALYSEKLVPQPLLDEIFKIQVAPDANSNTIGYGYGWVISNNLEHRSISHNGAASGFTADFVRFPDDNVTVIILSNIEGLMIDVITKYVVDRILD